MGIYHFAKNRIEMKKSKFMILTAFVINSNGSQSEDTSRKFVMRKKAVKNVYQNQKDITTVITKDGGTYHFKESVIEIYDLLNS